MSDLKSPEFDFISFVEQHSRVTGEDFGEEEFSRTVKYGLLKLVGAVTVPPIDEVEIEVWETKNQGDESGFHRQLRVVDDHFDEPRLSPGTLEDKIDDGNVWHLIRLKFRGEEISRVDHKIFGLTASTDEGVDSMQRDLVPSFVTELVRNLRALEESGNLVTA